MLQVQGWLPVLNMEVATLRLLSVSLNALHVPPARSQQMGFIATFQA